MQRPRYALRTYGCQMNQHDSEKLASLLHHAGYGLAPGEDEADLVLVNTCSIRDKAEHKLYSDLGVLSAWKRGGEGRAIGVGGCVAQQEGDRILKRFPAVDFVFGTHNLKLVPAMASAAFEGRRSVDVAERRSLDRFELPERHPDCPDLTPGRAWITVMEGCDMFCSFCIVPTTRGREISRPGEWIISEVEAAARRGVSEVTLLGQTVNAYGRQEARRGHAQEVGTLPFADLLARLDAIPGIERIRYTSPHPIFFDEALIEAHASLGSLCPHVHLPLQSGSDRILERMRRRYSARSYVALVQALRRARPDVAITTDLIVGFPGETEADFEATLSLVEEVGFVDHYSFKYSPRPGTAAGALDGEVGPDVAQERLERLQDAQRRLTLDYHRSRVGGKARVLVEGQSRRGNGQWAGRDPYHRVVNLVSGAKSVCPGAFVEVEIVEATPHSLIGEDACAMPVASPREGLWIEGVAKGVGSSA